MYEVFVLNANRTVFLELLFVLLNTAAQQGPGKTFWGSWKVLEKSGNIFC